MSLICQNQGNPVGEQRFFHHWVLPLSTLLPGIIVALGRGGEQWRLALLVVALGPLAAILGWFFPLIVRTLHLLAQALSWAIGWTISALIVLVLFFAVMFPLALVLRFVRKRAPLALHPDSSVSTYWEDSPPSTTAESALRQF
jgi:hypothetical protein